MSGWSTEGFSLFAATLSPLRGWPVARLRRAARRMAVAFGYSTGQLLKRALHLQLEKSRTERARVPRRAPVRRFKKAHGAAIVIDLEGWKLNRRG